MTSVSNWVERALTRAWFSFGGRAPVCIARTEAERRAIYRLRHSVYVEEQRRRGLPQVGAEVPEIRTPEDDEPEATLYYVGAPERIEATVRVRIFAPGRVPAALARQYSLERFADIGERTVAQVGFLIAPPTFRGTTSVVALTRGAVERSVREYGVDLMVADCVPGHLRSYRRLGLRPYGARVLSTSSGMAIPVVGITGDLDHVRASGSPWYPVLRRLALAGELPTRPFAPLLAALAGGGGVETDPRRVEAAVEARLPGLEGSFLARLPAATRRDLVRRALLLSVDSDVEVLKQGFANRDVFVLLDGAMELRLDDVPRKAVAAGEVLGEVAYFARDGQRSASLRSTRPCTILHLGHGTLGRIARSRPAHGVAIYRALAEVLAARLASSTPGTDLARFI